MKKRKNASVEYEAEAEAEAEAEVKVVYSIGESRSKRVDKKVPYYDNKEDLEDGRSTDKMVSEKEDGER